MSATRGKETGGAGAGRLLSGAVATLMLFALAAPGTVLAGSTSALMSVSVQVQARTLLNVESQPPSLVLTEADVARGYVDVPVGSRIRVRSNDPHGYLLAFEVSAGPFTALEVTGLGSTAQVSAAGGWLAQPYAGTASVTASLGYRFLLSGDARPGLYPWPVALTAASR